MQLIRSAFVALVAVGIFTGSAHALKVGDKAPALSSVDWLRGEPIPKFTPGHVYVLDFWATWCGPCMQSIPHLNALAKKHADQNVHVVGLAVWPRRGQRPTRAFIARRQDMNYQIGEDNLAGKVARDYLTSSGINTSPTAMIVDQQGKIAWIGHPMMQIDQVLEAVIAGSFDAKEQAKKDQKRQRALMKAQQLNQQIIAAQQEGDTEAMIELTGQLIDLDPELFAHAGVFRYYLLLVKNDDAAAAQAYAQELIGATLAKLPRGLDMLAAQIATNDGFSDEQRDLDLALQASIKSNELANYKDAISLDTLAKVHDARGDVRQALEWQTKAVELAVAGTVRDGMEMQLARYQSKLQADGAEGSEAP